MLRLVFTTRLLCIMDLDQFLNILQMYFTLIVTNKYTDHFCSICIEIRNYRNYVRILISATKAINNNNDYINIHDAVVNA